MTPASLLRGDRAATLHLVWSLALHLDTRAALAASTLPDTLGSPNTEVSSVLSEARRVLRLTLLT